MCHNLISLFLITSILFSSGGYDNGSSAGKGKWDISITWNPFNYFKHGQSYAIIGYGLTEKLDFHGYYSYMYDSNDNYYSGFSYQFYESKLLDLSTAIGIRKYKGISKSHVFLPQLLYSIKLNNKIGVGGSFVDIRNKNYKKLGQANDIFLMLNIHENNKYKLGISIGAFKPVLWKPTNSEWYPTYSIDIKFK